MTDQTPSRAAELARSSEIYRRLRSTAPLLPPEPAMDLPGGSQRIDSTRLPSPAIAPAAKPQPTPPGGPTFLRRMLTRRIDTREVLLLVVTLAVVIAAYR